MPDVGQGILDRMEAHSDHPIVDSAWGGNQDGTRWEQCWGTLGLYIASNVSGEWVTRGPFWRSDGDEVWFRKDTPRIQQPTTWSCAPSSFAWILTAVGRPTTGQQGIDLCASLVSPRDGLLDASGGTLAELLRSMGYRADNVDPVSWEELVDHRAGRHATMIGGRSWGPYGHWSGLADYNPETQGLVLKNPTEGYTGVGSELDHAEWSARGPWSCVSILGRARRGDAAARALATPGDATQAFVDYLTGALTEELQTLVSGLDDDVAAKPDLEAAIKDLVARKDLLAEYADMPPAIRTDRLARVLNSLTTESAQTLSSAIERIEDTDPLKADLRRAADTMRQCHSWHGEPAVSGRR